MMTCTTRDRERPINAAEGPNIFCEVDEKASESECKYDQSENEEGGNDLGDHKCEEEMTLLMTMTTNI